MATPSDQPPSPSIYAEFLPRLNSISIVVHLQTPSTPKTKALISPDASHLIIQHEGVITELRLPAKSRLAGEHLPDEIPPGLFKMSWRLMAAAEENATRVLAPRDEAVPWSAADLKPRVLIACRGCGAIVVEDWKIEEWKDLPSDNWAEMMEFWHCHKPTVNGSSGVNDNQEKASEDELAARGYGANSAITAKEGVGFVDLMTMMFHEEDCQGLRFSRGEFQHGSTCSRGFDDYRSVNVFCCGCRTQLGHFDTRKNGSLLFKWKLNIIEHTGADELITGEHVPFTNPPSLCHCLAAALAATQARSMSAKVVLQGDKEALTLWTISPDIRFSCNSKQGVAARKLLFQAKGRDEEEINLPDEVIREVKAALQKSNEYLPLEERNQVFNNQEGAWAVALLERWDPDMETLTNDVSETDESETSVHRDFEAASVESDLITFD